MGKPNFDIYAYYENKNHMEQEFFQRKQSLNVLQDLIRGRINELIIGKNYQIICLDDGRKYNWNMNSIIENNFTVLTHTGFLDEEEEKILNNILLPSDNIIDIGANKGWYSVLFARKSNKGNIYAIEPVQNAIVELQKNIELNNLTNIKIYNYGISNCDKDSNIYVPYNHSPLSSLKKVYEKTEYIEYCCKLMTLDNFYNINNLNNINFIKIDAEGSENDIILGGEKVLSSIDAPIIMIEIYEKLLKKFDSSASNLFDTLHSLGYFIYRIEQGNLVKIKQPQENGIYDVFCLKTYHNDRIKFLNSCKHH